MKKNIIKQFVQSLIGGLGLIWLFFEPYYTYNPDKEKISLLLLAGIGAIVGLAWFLIDGYCFGGFLLHSIKIKSNAIDTSITVKFGDLFTEEGYKAISVNEYFDSAVDENHVSSATLHGIMLKKFWGGNTRDWDEQVCSQLSDNTIMETVTRRTPPAKQNRYKLGTTALVTVENHKFLCVALSKTDLDNLEASANTTDLYESICGLLRKARTVCAGAPLNIPLMGNGLSRTGIKPSIIVNLIMLAIVEESKKKKVTSEIRIVLHKSMKKDIELSTIYDNWRI
jgi:Thoeris protein ThsA, Macro domain